jgi:hypothetical protein
MRVTRKWIEEWIAEINTEYDGKFKLQGYAPGLNNIIRITGSGCHNAIECGMSLKECRRFLHGFIEGMKFAREEKDDKEK